MRIQRFLGTARTSAALLTLSFVVAAKGAAQRESDRSTLCASAIAALTDASADAKRIDGVWRCPSIVGSLNTALRATRSVDVTARLSHIFTAGSLITDDRLANSALTLAMDATVNDRVRVYAARMLIAQVSPYAVLPPLSGSGRIGLAKPCMLDRYSSPSHVMETRLSVATKERIFAASAALYRRPESSAQLRSMANCMWSETWLQVSPPVEPGSIELEYVCGNNFRIRNRGFARARLTWDVANTGNRGTIIVQESRLTNPPVEQTFATTVVGTVQLYLNGRAIRATEHRDSSCTARN